ncbi:MAG: hypothetical protein HOP18_25665 [Deltaproteobacteria bacterium]|nr:hypothetical protein [Deltaproteobacteria bacterium]
MDTHEEHQDSVSLGDLVPENDNNPIAARVRMSGEFRLMWAVFEDGLDCYLRYADHPSHHMQERFREAKAWIESDEDKWLFSFVNICQVFQIDPSYLRNGLRRRVAEVYAKPSATPLRRAA